MSKRARTVYPPDMVAHLWANKSQDHARASGRGNIYFHGDTIYAAIAANLHYWAWMGSAGMGTARAVS